MKILQKIRVPGLLWLLPVLMAVMGQVLIVQKPAKSNVLGGMGLVPGRRFVVHGLGKKGTGKKNDPLPVSPRLEYLALGGILALAFFLRVYRLDQMPPGIDADAGFAGLGALHILHDGWRPFENVDYQCAPSLTLYCLALWLKFFSVSQVHFLLFFVFISLAGLGFFYWAIRQLTTPRTALLALFILAVMRWHIHFSRIGLLNIFTLVFMFGTLAFFLYGLQSSKSWPFIAGGIFFGLGLWTYQSYKAFLLLMMVFLIYEWMKSREGVRHNTKNITAFLVLAFLIMSPVILYWVRTGSVGVREGNLFIFNKVLEQRSLLPLWDHFKYVAWMMNWKADSHAQYNLPGYRLLDDATGILFILGLFLTCARFTKRAGFYAFSGLIVMSLPGLLNYDNREAHRMLGAAPFYRDDGGLVLGLDMDPHRRWKRPVTAKNRIPFSFSGLGLDGFSKWFPVFPSLPAIWRIVRPFCHRANRGRKNPGEMGETIQVFRFTIFFA